MKKILIINPNTSEDMTRDVQDTILRIRGKNVETEVIHPMFGPESLECKYDETIAGYAMIDLLKAKENEYSGVLIACYGDPCLYAIKEKMSCPVVGIAEASIAAALLLGNKFSILAAGKRAVPLMENMVRGYGMNERMASVECLDMAVSDVEKQKEEAVLRLVAAVERAMKKGAEVCILGCAGMTSLKEEVEKRTGGVILDPVEIGYGMLEMFVRYEIPMSKCNNFAFPPQKIYL